jgi:hypothetical protein
MEHFPKFDVFGGVRLPGSSAESEGRVVCPRKRTVSRFLCLLRIFVNSPRLPQVIENMATFKRLLGTVSIGILRAMQAPTIFGGRGLSIEAFGRHKRRLR